MKKILATIACLSACLASFAAAPKGVMVPMHKAPVSAPASRATSDNAVLFGPAGGMMIGVTSYYSTKQCVALRFDDADMELFAGNYISGILFAHGPIMDEGVDEAWVFVARSPEENNPWAGEGIIHEEHFKMTYPTAASFESLEFAEPILIDGTKGNMYVGWGVDKLTRDHTDQTNEETHLFGIDYLDHPAGYKSDFYGCVNPETGEWEWWRYGAGLGEFCVWAYVTGDNLPVNNVAIQDISVPTTIYRPGKDVECTLSLFNFGANTVTNVGLDITVGSEATVHKTADITMAYYGKGEVNVSVPCASEGLNVPITVKVTEINGEAENHSDAAEATSVVRVLASATPTYPRNVLVEEGTGTWCKYCPRGALAMEKMEEKYMADGRLMLVACHANDDMYIPQYYDILRTYMPSLPTATINRTITFNPEYTSVRSNYLSEIKRAAYASLAVEAAYNPGTTTVTLDADVTLALDDKGENYRLAFIITNNQVGPYDQQNAYAGTSLEKWGQLDEEVEMLFDHVAAAGTNALGIDILPSELKAGETVHVSHTIDFDDSPNIDNGNLEHCRYIVALVNAHNGQIENVAQTMTAANYAYDSIAEIEAEASAAPVYDLQGRRVANPTHGLYISDGKKFLK